ncbi:MAG: DNA repair protein RecN [Burkholderiaceae bacterium]|nr:DNA repair protein RecN [Burkholderiaceae bacterium]
MLQALRLRDFVIVDSLEIVFGPGFSVLSGETGAGKSILLDALALACGARADVSVVREGAQRADICAEFSCDAPLEAWLAEHELAGDPGVVLLRRVIDADGRTRALVNGLPATATLLREIGERLFDVHGQHAAQSLLRADGQRELLDAHAGASAALAAVSGAFAALRAATRDLDETERDARELGLERERLQWQVGELSRLRLAEGEWESLEAEQQRLAHAASLIDAARGAVDALTQGEDTVGARVHHVLHRLRQVLEVDATLREPLELLESAAIQLDEAASQLSDYAQRVDLDPERLEQVEARIAAIFDAARKFRLAPGEIPAALARFGERLEQLEAARDAQRLRARVAALRTDYEQAAAALSGARSAAARSFAAGVSALFAELGMAGGMLEVELERAEASATGIDRVEFRVAAHAGSTPRTLAKVASGGELSRIGLAIAVLAAQSNPVATLIFDEADAGIGGAVAEVVGALMRRLGEHRQVLCVTHLPQVAAQAHNQYAVSKASVGGATLTRVQLLDRAERVEEIARMLGGTEITATTRRHARELLASG